MAGVAVVTDSTASLGREQAEGAGIRIVPLQVVIDNVSRPEAPDGATPAMVAAALRDGQRVTTSRPSPEVFEATYADLVAQGFSAIVSVHLSRVMSGTYEAATIAAAAASVPVTVIDSQTLAMATGFAALAGAEAATAGQPAEQVAAVIRKQAATGVTYFCVDKLDYLRRGGRIGAAAALIGSALAVKPLLTVADGVIKPYERVRTASKARARLEELGLAALLRAAGHTARVDVAVHHLDQLGGAEALAQRLRGRVPSAGQIAVAELSAVLGVHVGPGTLGIVVSPRT
jgi:DegV family protein with EDD domain